MFDSSLSPVVCRRTHMILTLFVYSGVQHIIHCFSFLLVCLHIVSCVPNVTSLSGLSILDSPWVFSNVYLLVTPLQMVSGRCDWLLLDCYNITGGNWSSLVNYNIAVGN